MDGDMVVDFSSIGQDATAMVGGKGAHLAELSRIEGVRVPAGFCVTTEAFRAVMTRLPSLRGQLERLARLRADDREAIRMLSAEVRQSVGEVAIPAALAAAIIAALTRLGEPAGAYAVRSSATAEDMPTASFAGQLDTYLNVRGAAAVLRHVRGCWASLFTERAVTYRLKGGVDHRNVQMAVVIQQMVFPQAAGILFTADPLTSNRKLASVEASFGLGEALVSGRVNPDVYAVRDGAVIARTVAAKRLAIEALPAGGTHARAIAPERQAQPALTDAQILELERLGRRIEARFGRPQDIEWCLVDGGFQIVQSRPITTLFPIPPAGDDANHVYVSVGHQQMMTDPLKPLGLSVWQLTTARAMSEAGGRLFVDVTRALAGHLAALGRSDPLIGDALRSVFERDGFLPSGGEETRDPPPPWSAPDPIETDAAIVADLIKRNRASVTALRREIRAHSGTALLEFILDDLQELKRLLFDPRSLAAIMAGMQASWWLNEHLEAWLGERSAADTLARSAPHNVTSEMGLALLEVADVIRPHPEVLAFLQNAGDEFSLDELAALPGGGEARDAIQAFLDDYGMRCAGEIDITAPRWSERPAALAPMILADVRRFEPGAAARRYESGREAARSKERELLARLRDLPDGGEEHAEETARMVERLRTFTGYREYPKYGMVTRYFVYKQALLAEARRLVERGAIGDPEDIFYLRFEELQDLVRTASVDERIIRERREAYRSYLALTPPRVMTSEGEVITGSYRREDVPAGALVGLPVSAGTVEGRARVVRDLVHAELAPGDILVTVSTDPSWTPLFVAIEGLVTEVGGLMTHGSVIAREYGLPAVVGVEGATRLIRDGERIRVHGTEGYVEVLRSSPEGAGDGSACGA